MFKKASIYCYKPGAESGLEENLEAGKFLPVTDNAIKSSGWSPVRDGELCVTSHGHKLLVFTIEKKVIPGSALKLAVEERCSELEEQQGFAPGKKARAEIKERVFDELLPRALPTRASTKVWIDTERGRIIIDSSVVGTLELIIRALVMAAPFELSYLPAWGGAEMNIWMVAEGDDLPAGYTIDDAVQMEYPGGRGTVVAFKKADLEEDAVQMHLAAGAIVTKMALTFNSRVSFTLQPIHQLLNIKLLDVTKDNQVAKDADEFENNFILMALELRALIDSLSEQSE